MTQTDQSTSPLTIRIPTKTRKGLEELAVNMNRTKSSLAAEAIAHFVDLNDWQVSRIQQSLKDAEQGKFIAHDEVVSWLDSLATDNPLAVPTPKI